MDNVIVESKLMESNVKIENMIYEIRGVQIMLDSDLASLYEVETKRINEAVKNNPNKFPNRFSWILSIEEWENLRSKISTSSLENNYGGRRYLPRVFAEPGIYMLSTILKSKVAINASVRIMDTFTNMRKFINENKDIYKSINVINNKLLEHDEKFNYLFSKFDRKEQLLLKKHTYDAYISVLELLNNAEKEIIIIDNYADIALLDLIRNIKYQVVLITKNSPRLSNMEIKKYNNQYHNLKVIRDNSWHDRYFIIDGKEIYLSGTSINNIGNNTSMIIKVEDESVKKLILQNIDNIFSNDMNKTDNYT